MREVSKLHGTYSAKSLAAEIDAALHLLKDFSKTMETHSGNIIKAPATLLEQCLAICAQQRATQQEPIRTLHHFACTGGTLISKCVAAMPNTQLLSEVDPLSTPANPPAQPQFAPSDMVKLMRQSTRGVSDSLIIELFLNNLRIIYSEAVSTGQRLILRDHAHSHFCKGTEVPTRPNLREILQAEFPVLSVLTVRHPIDSYLSLKSNGWVNFKPASFDEYCKRYIFFLTAYKNVPIIRFEDFVNEPQQIMQKICSILDLPFNEQFIDLFNVNKLSGNSGRGGDIIEAKPRREIDSETANEISNSDNFKELNKLLEYP